MRILTICAIALLCVGCKTTRSAVDVAGGDYGPKPHNMRQMALASLEGHFKDPDSVKGVHIDDNVGRGYLDLRSIDKGVRFGWVTAFSANAKNSYGGYTGQKTILMLFRGRDLIGFDQGASDAYKVVPVDLGR